MGSDFPFSDPADALARIVRQALVGLPVCERLRSRRDIDCVVWPFETGLAAPPRKVGRDVVLAEIWPGAIEVDDRLHGTRDAAQVLSLVGWAARHDADGGLVRFLEVPGLAGAAARRRVEDDEGWILGFDPDDDVREE